MTLITVGVSALLIVTFGAWVSYLVVPLVVEEVVPRVVDAVLDALDI